MIDRILIIRPEWLDLILQGHKVWELRGSRTNIRGRIGLAASGAGVVSGTVDLVDCIGPLSGERLSLEHERHCVPPDRLQQISYRNVYAWVLDEVATLPRPMPFRHPTGAVIWVRSHPLQTDGT